jgi:hypothetical protein
MDASYQYSRILNQDTIRLILLQPSPDLEADIKCSLIQVSLQELEYHITEHYVALSYVWGDASLRRFLSVDEGRLEITATLDCALRHLRESSRVLRLWADGICIDQNDIQERNQQVGLMGSIYKLAQHTVIFLGSSSPETESAIQYISSRKHTKDISFAKDALQDHMRTVVYSNILSHPWFTRVWVLQELVLSRDPWIQKGRTRVRWDQFYKFAVPDNVLVTEQAADIISMEDIMTTYKGKNEPPNRLGRSEMCRTDKSLFEVLLERRGAGVTDPRDMLYAHLGLLPSPIDPPMEIDYNKSVADIYEHIARHFINKSQSLIILTYIEDKKLEDRRHDLPSWVPDWTSRSEIQPDCYSHLPRLEGHFPSSVPHTLIFRQHYYGRIKYLIEIQSTFKKLRQSRDEGPLSSTPHPPPYFDAPLRFGYFDSRILFSTPPGNDPFRDRITSFRPKDTPQTIYEAHSVICAEHFDQINEADVPESLNRLSLWSHRAYIASRFNVSTDDIPAKYNELLFKFAQLLCNMEIQDMDHDDRKDILLAVLDTGGCICVARHAEIGDGICRSNDGAYIVFRPTSTSESGDMVQRLKDDPLVEDLVDRFKSSSSSLMLGKYISTSHFSKSDESGGYDEYAGRALKQFWKEKNICLALH